MDDFKSKTLAFVYHVPFWEENGEVWTTYSPIGRYVEALAANFNTVILISPLRKETHQPLYRVRASNLQISTVRALDNVQSYYLHLFHFYARCLKTIKNADIVSIRMPTLTAYPAYIAAKFYNKPVFTVVVGENLEFIKLAGYSGIKKWVAHLVGGLQDLLMEEIIKKHPTFTNGEELYKKYSRFNKHVFMMRSSTINASDIMPTFRDTCQTDSLRILTVAVISPRKGTSLIPVIIAQLRDIGIEVNWTYIGNIEGNSGDMELTKTQNLARELGVDECLIFERPKGFSELLPLYRNSDIFVLPTYMEGIPRVILEAQASGLPVITTKVGGIPGAVKDGIDALLVEPGDASAMVAAILKVIRGHQFRKELIINGLSASLKNTVEAETNKMIENIQSFIKMETLR
jgi:glycosyltransferase involved in cell wall biosynthesis